MGTLNSTDIATIVNRWFTDRSLNPATLSIDHRAHEPLRVILTWTASDPEGPPIGRVTYNDLNALAVAFQACPGIVVNDIEVWSLPPEQVISPAFLPKPRARLLVIAKLFTRPT